MKISIKNMICPACVYFVMKELERLSIDYKAIRQGEIEFHNPISEETINLVKVALQPYGLEVVNKEKLIRKIKAAVRELVNSPELEAKVKLFEYVKRRVNQDYNYLNDLFLKEEGTSIEKYFITRKINRAIELLVYYNLNLTEITYQLNYSSISHLSNQFKTVTGLTPLRFKKQKLLTN